MRRAFRPQVSVPPAQRLAQAIEPLPTAARGALADVADRADLPLVAGQWQGPGGGCLVANVLVAAEVNDVADTLDVAVLERFPELSSRDLNRLIVAWDEAAGEAGAVDDADLRSLLHAALALVRAREPLRC